jgi:4-carboxymuconolactone decarboxylase
LRLRLQRSRTDRAQAGLPQSVVDALVRSERPAFDNAQEEAIYDFCHELHERHKISDKTYARALEIFGAPGVVELTALFGYYVMIAMTLLAHDMPVQEGARYRLTKPA